MTKRLWQAWGSGVFATATVGHLIRAIVRLPVRLGITEVPVWISWWVVGVAGALSVWLFQRARHRVME